MSKTITFLEIQRMLAQTKKARHGVKNRIDYFGEDFKEEKFYKEINRKCLSVANKVVEHCFEVGKIEKCYIVWGEQKKEKSDGDKKYLEALKMAAEYEKNWKDTAKQNSELVSENLELAEQVRQLKAKLNKYKQGGRKDDTEKEAYIVNYKLENPAATVREIAAALKVSTRTVQKVLVKHSLNGRRK